MMSGYTRALTPSTAFFMPFEPDGNSLRMDVKFDSGGDKLFDYSYMGNDINIGYDTDFPTLIKNTEDDGVTAGTIVSILDGSQNYYFIPVNSNNSIKNMVTTGQAGFSFVYRVYPITIANESRSAGSVKSNLVNFIENDQIDYAVKVELSDTGIIHFYVKYLTNTYYVATTVKQVPSILPPSYFTPDYDPTNYDTIASAPMDLPIPYVDLGFRFNFSTKVLDIFNNGVQQTTTTVTTAPSGTFPTPFADPTPPPATPQPYTQPFTNVYSQPTQTGSLKINAVTVSSQTQVYNTPAGVATTDPVVVQYNINQGTVAPANPFVDIGGIPGNDNNGIPLSKSTSDSTNCSVAALYISSTSSGLGAALNGKVITKATFHLSATTSVAGSYYCKIWDNNGNEVFSFGSKPVPAANTSFAATFQDTTNTVVMGLNYAIGIEYTNGNSSDVIYLSRVSNTDSSVAQAVVHPPHLPADTNWNVNTSYDIYSEFYTGGGTGGSNPYYSLNNVSGHYVAGEYFASGSPMTGLKPTKIELCVYRSSDAVGTLYIKHKNAYMNDIAILSSVAVSSLPTLAPSTLNLVWNDTTYNTALGSGDILCVEASGVTTGNVFIFNNANNTTSNNYDTTRSCLVYQDVGGSGGYIDTSLDIQGKISSGGATFTGYINLNDTRKRTGEKVNTSSSSLIGKVLTKVSAVFNKTGSPASSTIYCRIRDAGGNTKVTLGQISSDSIAAAPTSIDFVNTNNTYAMVLNDSVSIEYDLGTATDYIMVQVDTGYFEAENTSLFETTTLAPNTATAISNRDLTGSFYTGGIVDTTARYRRGIKINTNSILIGKSISEVDIYLKRTGTFGTGNTISVDILRGTDKTVISAINTIEASLISSTAFVTTAFQNIGNFYPLKAGDYIAITFNHGDSLNYIEAKISIADTIDGSNTCMFDFDGNVYTDNASQDLAGNLLIGGYQVFPDPSTPTPPTPYHWNHGWFLSSGIPPDSNALVDPTTLKPTVNTYSNNISNQFRLYSIIVTPQQLLNYYVNRLTTTNIAYGYTEIVCHDAVPFNTALQ